MAGEGFCRDITQVSSKFKPLQYLAVRCGSGWRSRSIRNKSRRCIEDGLFDLRLLCLNELQMNAGCFEGIAGFIGCKAKRVKLAVFAPFSLCQGTTEPLVSTCAGAFVAQ